MSKSVIKQPPEPLYIADPKERLINFFVDEVFDRLIKEVESEQEQETNHPKIN